MIAALLCLLLVGCLPWASETKTETAKAPKSKSNCAEGHKLVFDENGVGYCQTTETFDPCPNQKASSAVMWRATWQEHDRPETFNAGPWMLYTLAHDDCIERQAKNGFPLVYQLQPKPKPEE